MLIYLSRTIASIHQPNLFPRLKVLQKIFHSDIYICYDDVQFVRNDWQNRTLLRNIKDLQLFWAVVPVHKPFGQKSKINEVTIIEPNKTTETLRKQLSNAYGSSKYWKEIQEYISPVIQSACSSNLLSDFLFISLHRLIALLCPKVKIIRSSEINQYHTADRNMHLVELCYFVNANAYICGSGGLNYIDQSVFNSHGITLIIQNWNEKRIKEKYNDIFWRNICFIDFWARYGLHELKEYLGGSLNETGD